jgi:hypothetical protein
MGRHLHANGSELLAIPTGAETRDDTFSAKQRRHLRELAQNQRGVEEACVGHNGAHAQARRECGDRGQHRDGLVRQSAGCAIGRARHEQVIAGNTPLTPSASTKVTAESSSAVARTPLTPTATHNIRAT